MIRALVVATLAFFFTGSAFSQEPASRPNVLFIMADDFRFEPGVFPENRLAPNLHRLAQRGVVFERAYCQQAVCNPSRSSMLTGKRPDTIQVWCNSIHFRDRNPDVMTLPLWFKQHGYVTRDVGKIFHNWHTKAHGDRRSWSADEFLHYENHGNDKPQVDGEPPESLVMANRCERVDVPDEAYFDGRVANEAIRVLNEIKDQTFFLAVGFWKPHSPFNAPDAYWKRTELFQIPNLIPDRPLGAPEVAFHDSREILGAPPKNITPTAHDVENMRRGYYANISYMDAQLGKVLDALEASGKAGSTVIVFCGDHGYHLGEHGLWGKTSCFEYDAQVPLIISTPGLSTAGQSTKALAELIDLFPTLVDLCRLPAVAGLEGKSLVHVLKDTAATVKPAAFTQHPRPAYYDRTPSGQPQQMGYSVRTPEGRYTEWRDWKSGDVVARELYDTEDNRAELKNLVETPAAAQMLKTAVRLLKEQFPPTGH
ncbi:Choline-sulfatase [Caulifigura coniformis]|uniref:Choline-sulfatase n=1 Tax=Caulifigura coniformis TaxID=2527983 RepID=A0A517SJP9_9PLAN|nr:sulfatase [Caulifigura coniformis]QDT56350.1 Choline-sulfatase [Caulifigura coniformis]